MQSDKLFSERQKELRGEVPDVYQYGTIPLELRRQIVWIMHDIFDYPYSSTAKAETYKFIHDTLCRAYGEFGLGQDSDFYIPTAGNDYHDTVVRFLIYTDKTERVIDVIQLFFQRVKPQVLAQPQMEGSTPDARRNYSELLLYNTRKRRQYEEAITKLNRCFQERSVGYQYESGQMIRIDSEFAHSEVVKPALSMLSDPMYEGANAEFLKAHEHYRAGSYKECMNECLKAFESCIKAICEQRGWDYNETDTINRLIAIIFERGLIPDFMESHLSALRKALRNTLESGVPTVRNRLSGHGQGSEEVPVPEYMAAYALHLTASNILFLAKANEELK